MAKGLPQVGINPIFILDGCLYFAHNLELPNKTDHMNPKVTMGIRILFGLFCLIFGLNKFIGFIPIPAIPGDGGTLMGIYATSGFMKIIGVLEILFGLALILGKFIPLSLIIMGAIMFNAFVFHALHDMGGIGGSVLGVVLNLILVFAYKDKFKGLFSA